MQNIELKPYRLAKLNNFNGDLTKKWYIEFWAWSVDKGEMVRKRKFKELANLNTIYEREAKAQELIEIINADILQGKVFDSKKKQKKEIKKYVLLGKIRLEIKEELFNLYNKKKEAYSKKTNEQKKTIINRFLNFTNTLKIKKTVTEITKKDASDFQAYLLNKKKLANSTVNKTISEIRAYFQELIKEERIKKNPFEYVESLPTQKGSKNMAFDDVQIKKIKEELIKNNIQVWHFIQFIFYCYLRPKEIRRLKVKDINIEMQQIFVRSEISKNRRGTYIHMPNIIIDVIREMGVDMSNEDNYIFTKKNKKFPLAENYIYRLHKKTLLKCGITTDYTLYSWKHTGVVKAYQGGIDIKSIQLQCRHSDISMTDNYLKSLGFIKNIGFSSKIDQIKI